MRFAARVRDAGRAWTTTRKHTSSSRIVINDSDSGVGDGDRIDGIDSERRVPTSTRPR
jgi:hypothetical protein